MSIRKARLMYRDAQPKQFGNLHERMKYLIELAKKYGHDTPADLHHAIFDLRTEVEGHMPVKPPLGRRMVKL
jgi:hypothetical protein